MWACRGLRHRPASSTSGRASSPPGRERVQAISSETRFAHRAQPGRALLGDLGESRAGRAAQGGPLQPPLLGELPNGGPLQPPLLGELPSLGPLQPPLFGRAAQLGASPTPPVWASCPAWGVSNPPVWASCPTLGVSNPPCLGDLPRSAQCMSPSPGGGFGAGFGVRPVCFAQKCIRPKNAAQSA